MKKRLSLFTSAFVCLLTLSSQNAFSDKAPIKAPPEKEMKAEEKMEPTMDAKAAQSVAESWFASIDAGKYADAWKEYSPDLQKQTTLDQWTKAIKQARESFGKVASRRLKSATPESTLPGAPDGEYVVFKYETSFEKKKNAVETITAIHEKDGSWKISGYYIK